jgi:hypothetical protein
MNMIEDRLRAATQAAADTVADFSQPPLRLPAQATGYERPRTRIVAPRLMASVATATAVVAVAAIVVVARGVAASHQPPAGAQAAGSIPAGVPPFYLATIATKKGPNQSGRANEAAIVRTSTGKVLATVAVPRPFNAFGEVSASADDRTFVLAAEKFPRPLHGWVADDGPTRLYLLRFDPGAEHSVTLTALKIRMARDDNFPVGIALSPSGTKLAVESDQAGVGHPSKLRVYDLTNGTFRVWSLPNSETTASPAISSPSWVGGDRFLVALVYAKTPGRCLVGCVELLDTLHADSSILTASKTIFATASLHRIATWDSILVNTGGSRLILAGLTGRRQKDGSSLYDTAVLYNVTVPSGHVVSHLSDKSGNNFLPLWAGRKAGLMIIGRPSGEIAIMASVYSQHQRTPLRLPANTLDATW